MYHMIQFDVEEQYITDFLELPKKLYTRRERVQNEEEERELLLGKHVLSKYFSLYKLLVYQGDQACARCTVTIYPDDPVAYLGFFECIGDVTCAIVIFEAAERISAEQGCDKTVGPVNASFWIGYRLKTNHFDQKAFVGEPHNKANYLELFLACGYQITEKYRSNFYMRPPLIGYQNQKSMERYQKFISKGYEIVSPKKRDFDKIIKEIYRLIIVLYDDFPVFKQVSEVDFIRLFNRYRYILDWSFVKIAYYKQEAVGFMITVPDYGNLLYGKLGLMALVSVLLKKIRSGNYVILYMGVKRAHIGLGRAMVQSLTGNVQRKRAHIISALIKEGKVTGQYHAKEIVSSNTYVLLEKYNKKIDQQ